MYPKKRKYLTYTIIIILGVCTALLSAIMGLDKLSIYINNNDYELTRIDIFQIIFVSDNYSIYPYLSKNDVTILFLPISYYFISLMIGCSSFLLKDRSYFNFIYTRAGSKSKSIKIMKCPCMKMSMCFIFVFNCMLYIISHKCYLSGLLISENQLISLLILHSINSILLINFLQEVIFQVYCNKGVAEAFFTGTIALIIITIADMTIANINILLFNNQNYFIDGTILNIVFFLLVKYRKPVRSIQLPY